MKKRGLILTGTLLLITTLLGCAGDKNTQPVFGDKNKSYEGFTYLESAVLENRVSKQEAVIYMIKSANSYAIDEKSFSSNNGLSLSVELNPITYDETQSLEDNLSAIMDAKIEELEESESNTAYLTESEVVWTDDSKVIMATDYIWENDIRNEYTYKQHYYCMYQLDKKRQAFVELIITEEDVADEELLNLVLSEIEAYYGVHVDYNREMVDAKEEAYKDELERLKEEAEISKLTHEQGEYTFRLPEGYETTMSYDDFGMVIYTNGNQNIFLFMSTSMEASNGDVTDFEHLEEEDLNKLVKEQLQTRSNVDDMEFEKIKHDELGTVLKGTMVVTENGTKAYGVMYMFYGNGKMSMAMSTSPDEATAEECAEMYIESIQLKESDDEESEGESEEKSEENPDEEKKVEFKHF